ncbi:hypothetical protein AB0M45_02520 [Nocardia sp. NPDC051787]|uniref:hypothetical protein n=1 Tax=Nocardia sp. NPDC051787 TaxID=3155415 RepID=UPI00342EAF23
MWPPRVGAVVDDLLPRHPADGTSERHTVVTAALHLPPALVRMGSVRGADVARRETIEAKMARVPPTWFSIVVLGCVRGAPESPDRVPRVGAATSFRWAQTF